MNCTWPVRALLTVKTSIHGNVAVLPVGPLDFPGGFG